MSLSRAFTTRKLRMSTDTSDLKVPQRSQTLRHKISAPVQLIHTTNMLSYNAPDLPRRAMSSLNTSPVSISPVSTSSKSEDDTDSVATAETTPPTSPDVGSGERSSSPMPNHLSGFFRNPGKPLFPAESEPAPAIPQRSPSHTKQRSYDAIARSQSRRSKDSSEPPSSPKGTPTFSRTPSTSTRVSSTSTTRSAKLPVLPPPLALGLPNLEPQAKEMHPFGPEQAQVTELAEEYSSSSSLALVDEDADYLQSRGLVKFSVDDYLADIHGLASLFFSEPVSHVAAAPLWI